MPNDWIPQAARRILMLTFKTRQDQWKYIWIRFLCGMVIVFVKFSNQNQDLLAF